MCLLIAIALPLSLRLQTLLHKGRGKGRRWPSTPDIIIILITIII